MAEAEKQTKKKAVHQRSSNALRDSVTGKFSAVEAARRAGLLESGMSEHLSFRAPAALVRAAKRESGIDSPTELGILALSMLAQVDPVVAFLKRTRGRLGEDAELDY